MLFHFIVVILWSHTKHDNKLIAMQATLSYACGISDIPLKGETIGQNLRQIAAKFPERTALISEYQQYRANYSEFLEQVEQVAKALMAHGIRRGDRVGIWSPNRYEWVLVQYATALMGAIMVNINPGYKLSGLRYARSFDRFLPLPENRLYQNAGRAPSGLSLSQTNRHHRPRLGNFFIERFSGERCPTGRTGSLPAIRRSCQYPVYFGYNRLSQRSDSLPSQYPE